jgi:hypothetical protein
MNDTPTPRTDAAELTEPYEIRALGFCVVPIEFARQLERERDDWEEHAIKFANERESNAMQALAYKAERDEYRRIAGELVAAIRINTKHGTFATATIEDVDQWLKQWTDKFGPKPTFCPTNA